MKLTQADFISRCEKVHGGKYNYSKVVYTGIDNKIEIICPIHGIFFQSAYEHRKGHGCKLCAQNEASKKYSLGIESFIKRANIIHKNKYGYSKTIYKNRHSKVLVICPVHGEFEQLAGDHLEGRGCKHCGGTTRSNTEAFVEKATLIHGDRYDYSKVFYKTNRVKVAIVCKKHGDFLQSPNDHLTGYGCPKCNYSKGELAIEAFLKDKKLTFSPQFRLKDCRDKRSLPFDFAVFEDVEKTKLKCLIEYDGEQHFKICKNFKMTEEKLADTKRRDNIKSEYCKKNNIYLIRIPYFEFDNIQSILEKCLWQM